MRKALFLFLAAALILTPISAEAWVQETEYINEGIKVGEVSGSATAAQMPDIPAEMVMIKAVKGNAGNVYVGITGVTKPDGTTDATTGFELGAGETTGWIPVSNLNLLYYICDNAGDDFVYMIVH